MANKLLSNIELEELENRLQKRRLELNLSYQQLADKTGISKSTLQRYEKGGIKNLPFDKIPILSEALDVPVRYFTDLRVDRTIILEEVKNNSKQTNESKRIVKWDPENKRRKFHDYAHKYFEAKLTEKGYQVEVKPPNVLGDIVATRGKERWYIEFKYVHDLGSFSIIPTFIGLIGELAASKEQVTKYSILYNIDGIGDQLLEMFSTQYLNVDISLLYLTDDGYKEVPFNNN